MEILHKEFDFNSSLKDIDDLLAVTSEKVPKYHYIPTLDEIGDQDLFMCASSVVYLHVKPKHDQSLASFEEEVKGNSHVVTFRQRVIIQHVFVSLMREHMKCFDFMFFGDDMACILDTSFQPEIDELFELLAKLNSMLNIISRKSQFAGLTSLDWGIGVHYGETFVSTSRHFNNDMQFTWSGPAFKTSYDMSYLAIDKAPDTIFATEVFYKNLKDKYKEMMRKYDQGIYSANIINRPIKDWQTDNLDNK